MGEIVLYETMGLSIKNLSTEDKKQLKDSIKTYLTDSDIRKPTLMVRIDATHAGWPTGNNTIYSPLWMPKNMKTWTEPYEGPVLTHHEKEKDPIGRVKDSVYIDTSEIKDGPAGHIQLLASITDPDAIEKVLDERYNTVSIGASSSDVTCNICNKNIADDGLCSHQKGKSYKDKDGNERKCYWMIGELKYKELSFVNAPADPKARVVGMELLSPSMFNSDEMEHYLQIQEALEELNLSDRKLTPAARAKLPQSVFCGPDRSFPVPDEQHARAALFMLRRSKLSPEQKQKVRACILAKAKRSGWNIGRQTDQLPEEGKNLSKKLDQADLKFLENFSVAYSDVTPTEKDDVDLFIYAHNMLHDVYDEAEDKDEIEDLHLEIHQFIHSHAEHLHDLKAGSLDDTLSKLDKTGQTPSDSEISAKDIDSIEATYELNDKELEKIEGQLPEELRKKLEEAKLSYKSRKQLPDSAFCGPDRSFPAHDAAHVRNALARLPQAKMSPDTKSKILACLRRRAKRFGVKVGEKSRNVTKGSLDEFATKVEEIALHNASLEDILAMDIIQKHLESISAGNTVTKGQYDDLKILNEALETSLTKINVELKEAQATITKLEEKLREQETDLDSVLTENQKMQKKMHLILAEKVVDKRIQLRKPDTSEVIMASTEEDRKAAKVLLTSKYAEKSVDSLRDMIADLDEEIRVIGGNGNGGGTITNPGVTNPEKGNRKKISEYKDRASKTKHILFGDIDK